MRSRRIHITGASGAGVTSLGRAVANALALPHHDTDDYFWLPTTPPYRELRPLDDRLRLMREMFLPRADWVLSGALERWGNELVQNFDLVVFLRTPRDIRMLSCRRRIAVADREQPLGDGVAAARMMTLVPHAMDSPRRPPQRQQQAPDEYRHDNDDAKRQHDHAHRGCGFGAAP